METPNLDNAVAADAAHVQQAYDRRRRRYLWTSPAHEFDQQERERNTLRLLRRHDCMPLTGKTILEVGCGSGTLIQQFIRWGADPENVTGIDLRPSAVARARAALPAAVRLLDGNAAALPFAPATFDILVQSTMLTSVLDPAVRHRIAAEMLRVLRPAGLIIWYDFLVDNPANPDVSGVPKKQVADLFAGCRLQLERVTLLPPLRRWLAPRSWLLAYLCSHIPLLCTHYIGVITRAARIT